MGQYSSDTEFSRAAVFRAMPAFPVIEDPAQAAVLYRNYDGWGRHVLTGSAPPDLPATVAGPQWAQAQCRQREYGALAQDLLLALRKVSHASGQAVEAVDTTLGRVHDLLASNAVEQLRAEFAGMAVQLCDLMAQQREELDRRLGDLRERVELAEQARAQVESEVRELGQHLTDMREALDAARRQMQLDPLTELFNRGAFDAAFGRYVELARDSGQSLALVLLDIDHFEAHQRQFRAPGRRRGAARVQRSAQPGLSARR